MDELNEGFSVIFNNVKERYSPDDIKCQFTVKEYTSITEPASCCVGIFLIAWDSLESAVVKKNFSCVEFDYKTEIYNLIFDPADLVRNFEADKFYQFCFYDIVRKVIFGASLPFQIFNSNDDCDEANTTHMDVGESWWLKGSDKPSDEDMEDVEIIHNKTTLMEDALVNAGKYKKEGSMLTKQCPSEKEVIMKGTKSRAENFKQKNISVVGSELAFSSQNDAKQVEKLAAEKETFAKILLEKEAEHIYQIDKIKAEFNARTEASELRCHNLNKSLIAEKERVQAMEFHYEEINSTLREEIKKFCIQESESLFVKEGESSTETKDLAELRSKLSTEIAEKHENFNEICKLKQSVACLTEENKVKDILINAEHEKVVAVSLQQEEMTSRLNLESEKLRFEMDNLKFHESSLMDAYQKESSTHSKRIAEMESMAQYEKMKYKNDVGHLNDQLNEKINYINLLETKMRESENHFTEVHQQERLEKVEPQTSQLLDELSTKTICKNCNNGSRQALLVAIAHMQYQLNSYKNEIDRGGCQEKSNNLQLVKQNEEYRLRLCMGKKAFDKQYLECQVIKDKVSKLKKSMCSCISENYSPAEGHSPPLRYDNYDDSKNIDDLLKEIQKINEQKEKSEKEMINIIEDKNNVVKLNEELKAKLTQLVDYYEGKLNRLREENSVFKSQTDALLRGMDNHSADIFPAATSTSSEQCNLILMDRSVTPRTGNQNKDKKYESTNIVNQLSLAGNSSSTKQQSLPSVIERHIDIKYTTHMSRDEQEHLLSISPQEIPQSPKQVIAIPMIANDPLIRAEQPPSVVKSDRSPFFEQPANVICQGRLDSGIQNVPTEQCPICELDFPSNLTASWKTEHVNNHFDQ